LNNKLYETVESDIEEENKTTISNAEFEPYLDLMKQWARSKNH